MEGFNEAAVESILGEPDLLSILRWIEDLDLAGTVEIDERLADPRLIAAVLRNAVHDVELPVDGTSITTPVPNSLGL